MRPSLPGGARAQAKASEIGKQLAAAGGAESSSNIKCQHCGRTFNKEAGLRRRMEPGRSTWSRVGGGGGAGRGRGREIGRRLDSLEPGTIQGGPVQPIDLLYPLTFKGVGPRAGRGEGHRRGRGGG